MSNHKNMLRQTAGDRRHEEKKQMNNEIKEAKNVKKAALEAVSNVASTYDAKIQELNEIFFLVLSTVVSYEL